MDAAAYAIEAELGAVHWWFEGRRRILRAVVNGVVHPEASGFYDIGPGSGQNLEVWRQFGKVIAVDPSLEAIHLCQGRYDGVLQGSLERLPLANESADWLVATDVLEHLLDDAAGERAPQGDLLERSRLAAAMGPPAGREPSRNRSQTQHPALAGTRFRLNAPLRMARSVSGMVARRVPTPLRTMEDRRIRR
ncbi:MAG: class I SAM-dependent methyltransferase [Myxococcota bacterium]|jgi:SAM-dependent methyltransferase|nr:class I SAM-dependent methyltransferase [Myxococcota bacterium]